MSRDPNNRVAVAVVVWADATVPRWDSHVVRARRAGRQPKASAAFMANLPRIPEGGTGIGMGVAAAIRKLDRNGLSAPRQVVDVSGDGRETPPRENVVMMPMARALADARGVTINGLAIIDEEDLSLATLVSQQRHHRPGELRDHRRRLCGFRRSDPQEAAEGDPAPGAAELEVRRESRTLSPVARPERGASNVGELPLFHPLAEPTGTLSLKGEGDAYSLIRSASSSAALRRAQPRTPAFPTAPPSRRS